MSDRSRLTPGESVTGTLRGYLALDRDILVLSAAMFAFSLGYQGTNQYMAEYLYLLGSGPVVVGLFGSLGNLIAAMYPYPGGAISDCLGARRALTLFGLLSAVGFALWALAGTAPLITLPAFAAGPLDIPALAFPPLMFAGLFLVQCWKSFGLGATFALVSQSAGDDLATGFAVPETVRRLAFLLGPLAVAAVLTVFTFDVGFHVVLAAAAVFAVAGTLVQHRLYDASADSIGESFRGLETLIVDIRAFPRSLVSLLAADTLVRFANGMVYVFFIVFVGEYLAGSVTLPFVGSVSASAAFGGLLALEMAVALAVMVPVSRLADRVGYRPAVGLGFLVYALVPGLLAVAPKQGLVVGPVVVPPLALLGLLFAFSGLRFAGLPAHKALITAPAADESVGRTTGSYYLVRNTIGIPSAAVGGVLYAVSPTLAFMTASAIGLVGVALFAVGEKLTAPLARSHG